MTEVPCKLDSWFGIEIIWKQNDDIVLKFHKGDEIKGLVIRSANTKKFGKLNRSTNTRNIH